MKGYHSLFAAVLALLLFAQPVFGQSGRKKPKKYLDRGRILTMIADLQNEDKDNQRRVKEYLKRTKSLRRHVDKGGHTTEVVRMVNGMPLVFSTRSNLDAAGTNASAKLWLGAGHGFALSGSDIAIGVWDADRVRNTHQDFQETGASRVVQKDDLAIDPDNQFVGNHATKVAGTISALGLNPEARGMANGSTIWTYNWLQDEQEVAQAALEGLTLSNHSYGTINGWGGYIERDEGRLRTWYGDVTISETEDYRFGLYTGLSQTWDRIASLAPTLTIVKAAGNDRGANPNDPNGAHYYYDGTDWAYSEQPREADGGTSGFDSLPGDASTAKNIIVVGSIEGIPEGYKDPGEVIAFRGSSWGPTDDGRIKPDFVSQGASGFSTASTSDTAYGSYSGTSMATPSVTGSIALIQEQRERLGGDPLLSSTIRALLAHTADEAGPALGPDYSFGWGSVNAFEAVKLLTEDDLAGGETHVYEFGLAESQSLLFAVTAEEGIPLKATLAWTDPEGLAAEKIVDSRSPALVNDLDVRIVKVSDLTESMPWVLDPANPGAPATRGDNTVDNIEQVVLAQPDSGAYLIMVSHKGSLADGLQDASLIICGNRNEAMYTDQDGDGIYAIHEDPDGDQNIFNDDTDANGIPDYLDDDDDGDGVSTAKELNGKVTDGKPDADAPDLNGNGILDYLDALVSLPIELLSFEVNQVEPFTAEVRWITGTETNNAEFNIQMASGSDVFQTLGTIPGAGTTSDERYYSFRTEDLDAGTVKFRIQHVATTGEVGYSPVVEVVIDNAEDYVLSPPYPNPFNPRTTLQLYISETQRVRLTLHNALGQKVMSLQDQTLEGDQRHSIAIVAPGLPSGVYSIRATGEYFHASQSVTVIK